MSARPLRGTDLGGGIQRGANQDIPGIPVDQYASGRKYDFRRSRMNSEKDVERRQRAV